MRRHQLLVVLCHHAHIIAATLRFDYRFTSTTGVFPSVFNLAESADVFVNATCGAPEAEVYCTLASSAAQKNLTTHGSNTELECGVCDASKSDKAHSIEMAVDATAEDSWWQSPSIQYGAEYNYVTITVDLKNVFQIAYIILKSGPSPRPGNWILERSINGHQWAPWQFFAVSDQECWHAFGLEPTKGKPAYGYDEEVICTSYFSGIEPLKNGEVHVSLVNGRPGASGPSRTLVDFTQARFIRMRLQRLRMLPQDQHTRYEFLHKLRLRQYFYSLRDIAIGGQCPCNGHASECPVDYSTMEFTCKCQHHTCGPLCDHCCPMFNQKRWRPGKFISGNECEPCQCFGQADECFFDPQVEAERGSLNVEGKYEGGGVCIGCRDNTTGVNCQLCKKGFYRPAGVSRYDAHPCRPCQCDTFGSNGVCYPDSSSDPDGYQPGDCVCKPGYAGPKCTECARGFHEYPKCSPCPCSLAGTLNGECAGNCLCKENVQGERCDQCKPGHFALHEANAKGCLRCFCYAVTDRCAAAELGVEKVESAEGWRATDLRGNIEVVPYWSTLTGGVTVSDEDLNGRDTYYWAAPEVYLGNRLISYGLRLRARTSWHRGRGDTAGRLTRGPDVILVGMGGIAIGTGFESHEDSANTTLEAMLTEDQWYHIPDEVVDIPADSFEGVKEPKFIGRRVLKDDFMRILGSLEKLLIRAKYHTDQLEGSLYTAGLEIGSQKSSNLRKTTAVEQCFCPPGYEGLSCESCSYGYTRVNSTLFAGECRKCECNGHAATCDPFTFACDTCIHNTEGDRCERCKSGFYGDPSNGTPGDCRPCKCPLDVESNNFSPECQGSAADHRYDKYALAPPDEYVCTACPRGYAGAHCERCDNGYYGNPLKVGDVCKPCDCSGNANTYAPNWCDHRTGECLECTGNTGGWKCDRCLEGFYGNPFSGKCKACACNEFGSSSPGCDAETGKCPCKAKYVGRTCSQCQDGFGNLRAGCRRCNCHPIGSVAIDLCHPDTGQCDCKAGVSELTCDSCKDNFYGFSDLGCKPCNCHPKGATNLQCDLLTGQCSCFPMLKNKECNACMYGFWNINSGKGCVECHCDSMGSLGEDCDDSSGQCNCKRGIGGRTCNECLVGFWGFSSSGCTRCAPCEKPGHICDPDTGRCICPPYTEGQQCQRCKLGTWHYDSYEGCKPCKCHSSGAVSEQCNPSTGLCRCVHGYEGDRCDRCRPGFYNFPNCRPCNCNPDGTREDQCDENGNCQCSETGACKCKESVEGKKCASCRLGTFGLSSENSRGCLDCFCFGRTNSCTQGNHSWTQLSVSKPWHLIIRRGSSKFNFSHGLIVIPSPVANRGGGGEGVNSGGAVTTTIGVESIFTTPLYWSLPASFLGDKTLSYNGYLRFTTWSNGPRPYSPDVLLEYPLVQLQGNQKIVIEHFPTKISASGRYEVRLREDEWVLKGSGLPVTREMVMVALQSVDRILVRASDNEEATVTRLEHVSLDVGKMLTTPMRRAIGLEVCDCPRDYKSASCQDPGVGFYRWYEESYLTSEIIVDLAGSARRCECNGRTTTCHPETGECLNCLENTAGRHCEVCAVGYYGDPMLNDRCKPCQCPTAINNYAQTCSVDSEGTFACQCREGYTGPKCERCEYGYYGSSSGPCYPCDCNPVGSVSDQCDETSGQCQCAGPGITGRDCSQCKARHALTANAICKNCDDDVCTSSLLDRVDSIVKSLHLANVSHLDPTPEITLANFAKRNEDMVIKTKELDNQGDQLGNMKVVVDSLLRPKTKLAELESRKMSRSAARLRDESGETREDAVNTAVTLDRLADEIQGIIAHLRSYARGGSHEMKLNPILDEAKRLLHSIRLQDHRTTDIAARTELSYARQTLNMVKETLYGHQEAGRLGERLDEADRKLDDVLQHVHRALDNTRKAYDLTSEQSRILSRAQRNIAESNEKLLKIKEHERRGQNLFRQSRTTLTAASNYFRELEQTLQRLTGRGRKLEGIELGTSEVIEDYRSRYILPCQANAEKLVASAEGLKFMFDSAVGVSAEQAIAAANVYSSIIQALDQAREAAFGATDAALLAYARADPPGKEALGRISEWARVRSEDLSQEAEGLHRNALDMGHLLQRLNTRFQQHSALLEQYVKDLNVIRREQRRLPEVGDYSRQALSSANEALSEAQIAGAKVEELAVAISIDVRRRVNEMQSFSPEKLADIPRKLSDAWRTMQNVEKQAAYLKHRAKDVDELSERVGRELANAAASAVMARHAAAAIKISITNNMWLDSEDNKFSCIRSYRLSNLTGASVTNQFTVVYAVDDADVKDALLLYIPGMKNDEFLALEMVDRKISFLWDVGGGVTAITSNVTLETARNLKTEDHMWYIITAQRIGHVGRLNVRKARPVFDRPAFHLWTVGESSPRDAAHVFEPSGLLYVGGVPDFLRSPGLAPGRQFAGVMYQLSVDGRNIGLWNFVDNSGEGCRETHPGVLDHRFDDSGGCYTFDGRGYAMQRNLKSYDPRYLSLSMEFRSFDENALLLLIISKNERQYMHLSLRHGKLRLVICYGPGVSTNAGNVFIAFETSTTYNSGGWVGVEAARALRNGIETALLRVSFGGAREDLVNTVEAAEAIPFEMEECAIYFGGVPPNLRDSVAAATMSSSDSPGQLASFLGMMRGITVSNPGSNSVLNPLRAERFKHTPFFGVEPHCEFKPINVASFRGDGVLEISSQPLTTSSTFGFGFRTIAQEGLLLLSTFQGKEGDGDKLDDFYSVSLTEEGRLAFIFSSSHDRGNKVKFVSRRSYNDGRLHNVVVFRIGQKLKILVDDENLTEDGLLLGRSVGDIRCPDSGSGGLFLGGIPSLLEFAVRSSGMAETVSGFTGTIKNLAFIGENFVRIGHLNQPITFLKADVGREMYFGDDSDDHSSSSFDYQGHEGLTYPGCSQDNLDDLFAAHFSRHMRSSLSMRLRKEDLQRDFRISLKIRTFDQDGLIFASVNNKNLLVLYLQDTELRAEYHRRGSSDVSDVEVAEIEVADLFDNGLWKTLTLVKADTQLMLTVETDGEGKKTAAVATKVPKKLHINRHIWIGGVDVNDRRRVAGNESGYQYLSAIPYFNGCIRDFKVGLHKLALSTATTKNGISGCSRLVEPGFFLQGGNVQVSFSSFVTKMETEVQLAFKVIRAGTLLEASGPLGSFVIRIDPHLKVTALLKQGFGDELSFEVPGGAEGLGIKSTGATCSDTWHRLRIDLTEDFVTFLLNDGPPTVHVSRIGDVTTLLLGSDLAEDSFHGCAKNIQINGIVIDSTKFTKNGAVFINACPRLPR